MEWDRSDNVELPALTIPLQPVGSANTYKTTNFEGQKQRPVAFEQAQGVYLSCECLDIIHGQTEPGKAGAPATLVVFRFRFWWKGSRRIKRADVFFEFLDKEKSADGPEVKKISYEGGPFIYDYIKTKRKKSTEFSLVAGPPAILANVAVGMKRTVSKEYSAQEGKSITGTRQISGRSYSPKNCARWTFEENKSTLSGIIHEATVSVLLLRKNHPEAFHCNIRVNADADWLSNLQRLVATPLDDPINFDPMLSPTKRLWEKHEELGSVPIEEIDGPFTNVRPGPTIVTEMADG